MIGIDDTGVDNNEFMFDFDLDDIAGTKDSTSKSAPNASSGSSGNQSTVGADHITSQQNQETKAEGDKSAPNTDSGTNVETQRSDCTADVDILWFEKYRPKDLDQLILPEDFKLKIREWILAGEIPNLLFSGPPGTGKSSTARLLIKYICKSPRDFMVLSTTQERKLNVFKEKLEPYLRTKPHKSKVKIVLIEEVAASGLGLTKQSMDTLLHYAEGDYTKYTRFILTTNYPHKLPPAIRSRFQHYEFKELPKHFVLSKCEQILKSENVQYDKELVKQIVDILYPNFRTIIQALEMMTVRDDKTGQKRLSEQMFERVIPALLFTNTSQMLSAIVSLAWDIRNERGLDRLLSIVTPDLIQKLVSTQAKDILPLLKAGRDSVDVLNVYTELVQTGKLNPTVADLLVMLLEQQV